MISPILRGFDFPEREIDDQLRLCNPLLSFEEGESAPIFLARDLNWQPGGENNAGWLARVDVDEVESFGTLVSGNPQRILRGEGVVLLGERLFSVAREARIDLENIRDVKLKTFVGAGYRIGLAGVDAYHRFARKLARAAAKVFDEELDNTSGWRLSVSGVAALVLLRKCGMTSPSALAIRQLVAARIGGHTDRYRRLLVRFSLELGELEDDVHKRVSRHIEVARDAIGRTTEPFLRPRNFWIYEIDAVKKIDVFKRKRLSYSILSRVEKSASDGVSAQNVRGETGQGAMPVTVSDMKWNSGFEWTPFIPRYTSLPPRRSWEFVGDLMWSGNPILSGSPEIRDDGVFISGSAIVQNQPNISESKKKVRYLSSEVMAQEKLVSNVSVDNCGILHTSDIFRPYETWNLRYEHRSRRTS